MHSVQHTFLQAMRDIGEETTININEGLTMILQKYTVIKSGKSPIPSDTCKHALTTH